MVDEAARRSRSRPTPAAGRGPARSSTCDVRCVASGATARTPGSRASASNATGFVGFDCTTTLKPPDASLVNWPIWPANIAENTDTSTRMKTTSANIPSVIDVRKRRASGYASPSRTRKRPLARRARRRARSPPGAARRARPPRRRARDPARRTAARRRCMSSASATGTAATAHTSTANATTVFDDRPREVARQHRRDADEHEHRTEQQREERRRRRSPTPVSSRPDDRGARARRSTNGGAVGAARGSVMSRIAWMMLKRLSQMLVSTTVASAMTNPTTMPALHARPLEREVQRDAGVVAAPARTASRPRPSARARARARRTCPRSPRRPRSTTLRSRTRR